MNCRTALAALLLILTAAFVPLPRQPSAIEVEPSVIIQHLVDREASLARTRVTCRYTRLTTDSAAWSSLRQQLLATQSSDAAENDPRSVAEQWLNATPASGRECWNEKVVTDQTGTGFRRSMISRHRVVDCDTVYQSLPVQDAPGAHVVPPVLEQFVRTVGNTVDVLNDRRWLIQSQSAGVNYPLIPLDPTLAPWVIALETPTVSGQTLTAYAEENRHSLVYNIAMPDGTTSEARYDFDQLRNWAPTRVVMSEAGVVKDDRIIAYAAAPQVAVRPAVVAHMKAIGAQVYVSVFVIEQWSDTVTDSDFAMRLPPLRREVDLIPNGTSVVRYVVPSFLSHVHPSERLAAAITHILLHWWTNAEDADFNADGIVDEFDLEYVTETQAL